MAKSLSAAARVLLLNRVDAALRSGQLAMMSNDAYAALMAILISEDFPPIDPPLINARKLLIERVSGEQLAVKVG